MKLPRFIRLPRFVRSVFTKLIVISIATWFVILIALVATFLISRHDTRGPFYKNASRYIEYIVEDIGSPPDKEKALRLSQKTGMHLSYQGATGQWTTREIFPALDDVRFRKLKDDSMLQVGRKHRRHYLSLQTQEGVFFFEFAGAHEKDRQHQNNHLLLLLILSIILLGSYFAIKRVLTPLKWLGAGVQQVKTGNLSHRVPLRGNDELTDLGRSFNEMTTELKKMMTAKEHLLRDISHELRTPLTRIRVALEMMKNGDLKDDIAADIAEMEDMISGILETAKDHHRNSSGQNLKKHNLGDLIAAVARKYQNNRPPVVFTAPVDPLYSMIDAKSIQTLIVNCIENGLKFSEGDGDPIKIELQQQRNAGIITITDHGSGIDEAELPYIFEPFYRADASRSRKTGGYGLGLSICKAIIEAHGGSIKVYSKIGEGTRILCSLPLSN